MKIQSGLGLCAYVLWLCLALMPSLATAQDNSIESISSSQQGQTTVVRINLKSPPAALPGSFAVSNPPRVAFDFGVRNVSLAQSGKRSRVVFNLRRPMTYNTLVEGNTIVVTLDPSGAGDTLATPQPSVYSVAKADSKSDHALKDIDFRRGKDGEGRIVIDLSDPQVAVDIRQQGNQVVVDFLRSKLPDNLRRRLPEWSSSHKVCGNTMPIKAIINLSLK
jgi:type IV pilus assembly protein PilQ